MVVAICIARDNCPISTHIECLPRDRLDTRLTNVPAPMINIPCILFTVVAEHVGCYIFAGNFERTFFLLNPKRVQPIRYPKTTAIVRATYAVCIAKLLPYQFLLPALAERALTYIPDVLLQATRTHLPSPFGVLHIPPFLASL